MAAVFEAGAPESCAWLAESVCVLGVFDGVHRGHRYLIEEAAKDAAVRGSRCVVLTFDVDPDELFVPGFRKIMSNDDRLAALERTGVDAVGVIRFDHALAKLSPTAFLDGLFGSCPPQSIHVGRDFRFGCRAGGTTADLAAWGSAHGMACTAHGLLEIGKEPVTSTRIRGLLQEGSIEEAEELLGHPYSIGGTVLHGREAGREMGIRTANLSVPEDLRVLADGVYAAYAVVDGCRYAAAVSVGIPPTFAGEAISNTEAHLLGFEGDLYGGGIRLDFVHRLRAMERFADVADLVTAIEGDIAWVRQNL